MRNDLLIICMIFTALAGCKESDKATNQQYFTGQIKYAYTYTSDELNIDSLKEIKPSKSVFRYDLHNYQSEFIGKDTLAYYYASQPNKCLSAKNGDLDKSCEDYSIETDSIISFKVYDTDEKVLGYTCQILEFQSKYFWNRFYVSKDLKIAPDTYNKHKAYNWSFYGNKTKGGLILKLEHRFAKYTMSGIATEIKPFEKGKEEALLIDKQLFEQCK